MSTPRTRAQQTAINLTLLGIDGQIRLAQRRLVELDEFDAEYGEKGAESRAEGRIRYTEDLARCQEAFEVRKAALSPEKLVVEAGVVEAHATIRELTAR
jgi:hypothetical protein